MDVRAGRPDLNVRSMLGFIQRARSAGAAIVAFPEMCVPGYILGDAWEIDAMIEDYEGWSVEIRDASRGIAVVFGNVAIDRGVIGEDGRARKLNAAWVCHDGRFIERAGLPARLPHGVQPEDASPELPVLRRRPTLLLTAKDRRGDRHPRVGLDGPLRHPDPTRRRAARGAALRGHLVPGLQLSSRAAGYPARVASRRRRPRRQPLRVAMDLAEERQAQPCGARGDGALSGPVLLREQGRGAEQRKEHPRVRRRHLRVPHRRHAGRPGAALARGAAGARRGAARPGEARRRPARLGRRPRARGTAASRTSRHAAPPRPRSRRFTTQS